MDRPGVTALRLVLLGDGAWAARSLERLQAGPHEVVAVLLRQRPSDPSLADAARRLGVPVHRPARVNADDTLALLTELAPDLLVSIAYDQILRAPVRALARSGAINFHAGMLPFYRGRNVVNWAIINGESEIGLTSHRMDDGIDTGDILLQRSVPVGWTDTYGDLLARLTSAMPDLVADTLDGLAAGTLAGRVQRYHPGSYFGKRKDGDEWLDWSDTSRNLHNKVRAIAHPGPGARTHLGNSPVIVWHAFYDPAWPSYLATPGQVVGRTDRGVIVKTGDSTLLVERTEVDGGGEAVPAWPVGTQLGANAGCMFRHAVQRHGTSERQPQWEESHDRA